MSAAFSNRERLIRQRRPESQAEIDPRPVTRQITRPVTRPVTRQITRPVTRQITRPVTRQITRPVARPGGTRNRARHNSRNKTNSQQLRVVTPPAKSKFSKVTFGIFALASVLTFIVIFRTVIAEQQLRLEKVSTDVRLARQHYNELRQQRAELRAPDYLRAQAIMLGMWPGSGAKFEEIPSDVVTMVLASTGEMDDSIALPRKTDEIVLEIVGSAP